MEFILLFVIILQFAYIIYKDNLHSKETERLQLKLMSNDVGDYARATEEPKEESNWGSKDVLIPIEEATVEQVVNG